MRIYDRLISQRIHHSWQYQYTTHVSNLDRGETIRSIHTTVSFSVNINITILLKRIYIFFKVKHRHVWLMQQLIVSMNLDKTKVFIFSLYVLILSIFKSSVSNKDEQRVAMVILGSSSNPTKSSRCFFLSKMCCLYYTVLVWSIHGIVCDLQNLNILFYNRANIYWNNIDVYVLVFYKTKWHTCHLIIHI